VYHGNGGFTHERVYEMPIWLRKFHIKKIVDYLEDLNKEKDKQNNNRSSSKPAQNPYQTNPNKLYRGKT
jgi:hypothetical protein